MNCKSEVYEKFNKNDTHSHYNIFSNTSDPYIKTKALNNSGMYLNVKTEGSQLYKREFATPTGQEWNTMSAMKVKNLRRILPMYFQIDQLQVAFG